MSTTAISVAVGKEIARADMRNSSAWEGGGESHRGGEVWSLRGVVVESAKEGVHNGL